MTTNKFNIAVLDNDLQLKNRTENRSSSSGSLPFKIHTYSYVRMYKRTQFSMNVGVNNIQTYFASKYRPNVFTVPITIRANGIVTDQELLEYKALKTSRMISPEEDVGPSMMTMWYTEFVNPCRSILSDFIDHLLHPADMILTSVQLGQDTGQDIINLVNDTNMGTRANYNSVNIHTTYNYKVFYPIWSQQDNRTSSTSSTLDGRVIGLQVGAQDKIYNLTKQMITYTPFGS